MGESIIGPAIGLIGSLFGGGGGGGGGSQQPQITQPNPDDTMPSWLKLTSREAAAAIQKGMEDPTRQEYFKNGMSIKNLFGQGAIPPVDPFGSSYGKNIMSGVLGNAPQNALSQYMAGYLTGDKMPAQQLMQSLQGMGINPQSGPNQMMGGPPLVGMGGASSGKITPSTGSYSQSGGSFYPPGGSPGSGAKPSAPSAGQGNGSWNKMVVSLSR